MIEYESYSYDDTAQIAAEFADTLNGGEFIAMYGDLGAGKTAFVQGLAKALGITQHVTSPTFTIVNEYEGRLPLYHFDVYRIADPDEMYEIGYEDYLDAGGVCIVEWAELIEELFPEDYIKISILKDDEKGFDYRHIILEGKEL
ncbi:MAG: tRNA (adenosine(37)-N6)-threonylcarbamoyltransferase complex ATPase subunit type 1 TsaE [Oscillospiraceae bacterium]|nr:tRNA (adenosine(37)-N6)-threonylcarbamoyltransferase complex ATPase subunit type 1 TsaE [Oscillospiraceae bacterium]